MPLYLSVPLPGPFRYSKRVGGGKRRRSGPPEPDPDAKGLVILLVAVCMLISWLGWWAVLGLAVLVLALVASRTPTP